ncbi:MAG TPA: AMP-binding protein [Steroidobacter sp.]
MLLDAIERAVRLRAGAPATICDGRILTWQQLVARISRLAGALRGMDVQESSPVGILGLNSDRYLEAMYAIWWAGGVAVPMNFRFAVAEHLHCIDETEIRVIFVDEHFVDTARQLAAQRPHLRLIAMGDAPVEGFNAYEQLIAGAPPADPVRRPSDVHAGIFYTGGTTGIPKGVMHSMRSLWSGAVCLGMGFHPPEHLRYLHTTPMFHLGDLALSCLTTLCAGTHVFLAQFTCESFVRLVGQYGVQATALVPTMVSRLLDSGLMRGEATKSLHTLIFGGSPIAETELNRLRETLPGVQLCQIFGQTETAANGTLLRDDEHGRSAGRALFGNLVGVFDQQGRELPPGATGEIWVKGPAAMLGYWRNPDLTASTLTDGWVHTGDAGYMDEEGYIYICDRLKDMIITGGENVYCAEVENAIAAHPSVAQVAVIGVPDEKWGERVHAVIVLHPGKTLTLEALQEHCRSRIAGYKLPRSMELRTESLPLSAVGKVLKTALREPYWAGKTRNVN